MIRLPAELNEVLEQGGSVVVPSRQRAHAARLAHAAAELSRGRRVWPTPDILSVDAWLTRELERHAAGSGAAVPRLLSPAEEWFLWRQCAAEASGELELVNRAALAESLRRAGAVAADFGIDIRAAAGPELEGLGAGESVGAGTEAQLLAQVQRAVEERCRTLGAATVGSLVPQLRATQRLAPVVGCGFLTLPPRLRALMVPLSGSEGAEALVTPGIVIANDELDELDRIAQWCKSQVDADPSTRLLVALPGAPGTRERLATLVRQAIDPNGALGGTATAGASASTAASAPTSTVASAPAFAAVSAPTFAVASASSVAPAPAALTQVASDSLVVIEGGTPLARVPAVAHALATLSWLGDRSGDFEAVSEWLRAPYWHAPAAGARARLDLWLRERERMHFTLRELVGALTGAPSTLASAAREIAAQVNKAGVALGQGAASAREWSERFKAALEAFGWPGERARGSGEQQTLVRFYELLDEFGQLAAAMRSISRDNAIQWFGELAARTAYRPADNDAVVTISSTLVAPVVRYDAIWIAGLHAEAFPQPVQPDPFIPLAAQLAAGVPAASAAGRLAEARALLTSWRAAADGLVLSTPARAQDLELLPSPLLAEWMSAAQAGPAVAPRPAQASQPWLPLRLHREAMLESLVDDVGVVWPIDKPLPSGTRSLELQNNCPFRAYAELRLGGSPLDAPEPGIAVDMRGQLLHAALQKLWQRLRDSRGLESLPDAALQALIHRCVDEAANEVVRGEHSHRGRPLPNSDAQGDLFGDPNRSPALSRECRRAERLIHALCGVERERAPFRVENTEFDSTLRLVGAQLRVRIDRVDVLDSGGRAILDYKSGRRAIADWYGERPSHPQLLAYLAALGDDVLAMATVNVTAREVRFDGIASSSQLLPKVRGVEGPFGTDQSDAWSLRRQEWLARVERLAVDFIAGRASVDPKPGACDYCHVASVCRIADRATQVDPENAGGDSVDG